MNLRFYKSVTDAKDEFNRQFPVESLIKITDEEHLDKKPIIGKLCEPAKLFTRNNYKQIEVKVLYVMNENSQKANILCSTMAVTITKMNVEHITLEEYNELRKQWYKSEIEHCKDNIKTIKKRILELKQQSLHVDKETAEWLKRTEEWFDIQKKSEKK